MQKIIGREPEIQEFKKILASRKPEFLVVYGRRRVGKTYLVREYFSPIMSFHHTGLSPVEVLGDNMIFSQLQAFSVSLRTYGLRDFPVPKDWISAFELLKTLLTDKIKKDPKKKQVVFIDELPWMDTPRSGFVTALEHFWNGWASGIPQIMLIVCGSATSWISDKILHNKGGLYNRITREIKLHPFTLHETELFYKDRGISLKRYAQLQMYMRLGGIPYYLSLIEKGMSVDQITEYLLTGKEAKLRDELDQLFVSLFTNHQDCLKIIRFLATRKEGYTKKDIAQKTKIPDGGGLTNTLKALSESDFIQKYTFYGKPQKEERYRIVDFFTLYWLSIVEKKKQPDSKDWKDKTGKKAMDAWQGFAFESVCWYHIAQIKKALGIPSVNTEEFTWRNEGGNDFPGAQIDLIIRRADNVINLCEMKFYSSEYITEKTDDANIRNKQAVFERITKCKETIHPILITTFGLTQNQYSDIFQKTVVMDDLFVG
ncbi:MAG: ATP-binding protein [Bacteroidales bacterium]|nr:ATP-binding protein [Bacteroidales bacterium]